MNYMSLSVGFHISLMGTIYPEYTVYVMLYMHN